MPPAAPQHRGQGIREPGGHRAEAEQPGAIAGRRCRCLRPPDPTDDAAREPDQEQNVESREAERDQQRVQHKRGGLLSPPGAERPGDGGDDPAAHGTGRHLAHQQGEGQHHRPAGQCRRALPRGEPGFDQLAGGLDRSAEGGRCGKGQNAPRQDAGARISQGAGRRSGRASNAARLSPQRFQRAAGGGAWQSRRGSIPGRRFALR